MSSKDAGKNGESLYTLKRLREMPPAPPGGMGLLPVAENCCDDMAHLADALAKVWSDLTEIQGMLKVLRRNMLVEEQALRRSARHQDAAALSAHLRALTEVRRRVGLLLLRLEP